jgi:TMEM175 potassium channel family protein
MTESPARLEAFSDGVFAIAITLLILEIKVPHAEHGLWAGLASLWPSYVAFLMSFFVILIMWVNHHELLRMVSRVNYPILFANGLLLLSVTFVPFPTAVLAEHLGKPEAKTAVVFYCGTFVVNAFMWQVLFNAMVHSGLLRPECTPATIARVRQAYYLGLTVYLVATVVALIRPWLGLVINVSLWILWIRLGYRSDSRRPAH